MAMKGEDTDTDTDTTITGAAREAIRPFPVCTNVELGPLLPSIGDVNKTQQENIRRQIWKQQVKKTTNIISKEEEQEPKIIKPTFVEAISTDLDANEEERWKVCRPVLQDFDSINLLAQTVHKVFYDHYPLRLGPDVIWLTILQGLAKHIDQDPEGQRKNLVNFQGKQTLVIRRPDFVKGSSNNDWTTVFPEFAAMVERYIGKDKVSAMTCDFTTSTTTDRICSQIALMDTVKHYFNYRALAGCGIPSIELTGTVDDWVSLRDKAEILCEFDDLAWWTEELFPVLDHFVKAARGNPDIKFWKSVCNVRGLSGMWLNYVNGWVQVFFPYTTTGRRHHQLGECRKNNELGSGRETEDCNRGILPHSTRGYFGDDKAGLGLKLKHIPVGVSQAPFEYEDVSSGRKYDMTFNAGIVAIVQNQATRALEPVTGWAILEQGELQNSRKRQREN
mmetsp:Transcript_86953/g.130362  ORF Transcript_86953/g.130362 Transcript_86953/m.130362 type:complete len:447 (-) Transcript_86953:284-1624(-)